MDFTLLTVFLSVGLLGLMVAFLEIGRRAGRKKLEADEDKEGGRAGLGAIEGAVFGLFGLLVAFTFAGAAQRFDERRELIAKEANAIGTAWLRLDMLPLEAQPPIRDGFRNYLDKRLEAYGLLPDVDAALSKLTDATAIADRIWDGATAACRTDEGRPALMLVLPSLNEMFDIAEERLAAAFRHPPTVIFVMLFVLSVAVSLFAGFAMSASKKRSWIHVAGFALVVAATFYVIIDLEYPRIGLIRIDSADQILYDVRESMK